MQPNYPDGQYLLTDKVSYRFGEPERGDVIVFEAPSNNDEEYIKRIIGLPGERVTLKNNKILINGVVLNESYIGPRIITKGGHFLREGETINVQTDEYFVLGDNRSRSSDSRSWGLVVKDKITGRAWIIYWPPQDIGTIQEPEY